MSVPFGSALKLSIIKIRGFRVPVYLSTDRLVDRGQSFPQLAFGCCGVRLRIQREAVWP